MVTLSSFRNRPRQIGKVYYVIAIVAIYAFVSSILISHKVYITTGVKSSKSTANDTFVVRSLKAVFQLSQTNNSYSSGDGSVDAPNYETDPIAAVLKSALDAVFSVTSTTSLFGEVDENDVYDEETSDNNDDDSDDDDTKTDDATTTEISTKTDDDTTTEISTTTDDDTTTEISTKTDSYGNDREAYYKQFNDGLPIGIISRKDQSFFDKIRNDLDNADNVARCLRYNGYYNEKHPNNRRIFYGALMASESWELFELASAEAYGLYSGVVLVEGNRTQNFTPRKFERLHHKETFSKLFGISQIQIRAFVQEDPKLLDLYREHMQRAEIIKGWKELGMTGDDIGLLADADETFTRDFLKAAQICHGIEILDYESHHCNHLKVKLVGVTRVFESTSECISKDRAWFHPDMIIGHCIEGISNYTTLHNPAPRIPEKYSFLRQQGYGGTEWNIQKEIKNNSYTLWNAADFRRASGGYMLGIRPKHLQYVDKNDGATVVLDRYSGYHFHNFFAQFKTTRFKYLTYAHPDKLVNTKRIPEMSNDLKMMYKCMMNEEDSKDQKWTYIRGGYQEMNPFRPVYFYDDDYRKRRHQHVYEMVQEDELLINEKRIQEQIELSSSSTNTTTTSSESSTENLATPTSPAVQTVRKDAGAPVSTIIKRTVTDTGIDVTDPRLYIGDRTLNGDSTTATVIALATNYDLETYQRFVGSLRKSGFKGHIILGLHPDVSEQILDYMKFRNVTVKLLQWTNCTYTKSKEEAQDIFKKTKCSHPYPDIKIRWSRFPLTRDWLLECTTCTGPVLVTDARDAVFQLDPFGIGSPQVSGLQVFREHVNMTTKNWLTNWPIGDCKGVSYNEPMLCSGTTIGTRLAILKYLEIMYAEMKVWIETPKCRFDINGDDQSIHNYLYYSGQLPFATNIANRRGGIVNTIGHHAAQINKKRNKEGKSKYNGSNKKTWIGLEYGVTNEDGLFTEFDGTLSRVIHQWDRFDSPFYLWIRRQNWAVDNVEYQNYLKTGVVQSDGMSLPRQIYEKQKVTSDEKNSSSTNGQVISNMRMTTDTGIDLTDPDLYESVDVKGDSTTATVMALASGYDIETYERFVGTLRKSGFKGHIFLGVSPDVKKNVLKYFQFRNVTPKILKWVNCTYTKDPKEKTDIFKQTTCAYPYPDIKIRWSRFPLARDWLRDCKTCTGPVLIMDARDSLFQRDPFGPGSPVVTGLQVFEEHVNMTTKNWLTNWPISKCKGVSYDEPMLCSGTTVGTRAAMLKYLEIMYAEMKVWIENTKCRFDINGDDQSIHNYLFYSGQLPFAESIVNRKGGIVNTIGHHAAQIAKQHFKRLEDEKGLEKSEAAKIPYSGANSQTWIGPEFGITNEFGQFTEFDGSLSRVVHQWDRFHRMYDDWLRHQSFIRDPMPKN